MMIDFSWQKINIRLDFMTKNLHRSRQPLIICSLGRLSLRSPFSYTPKAVNFLLFHHDEVMVNVMETCSTQISGYRPDCLTCKCPSSCQLLPILCTSQYLPLLFLSSNYAHGFKVFCFYIFCIWKMLLKYAKSLQGISGAAELLVLMHRNAKRLQAPKNEQQDGLLYSQDKHIFLMMCLPWAETLSQAEGKGSPRAWN